MMPSVTRAATDIPRPQFTPPVLDLPRPGRPIIVPLDPDIDGRRRQRRRRRLRNAALAIAVSAAIAGGVVYRVEAVQPSQAPATAPAGR